MVAMSQMCFGHVDSHCWSKVYSETGRSSVEILVANAHFIRIVWCSLLFYLVW